MYSDLLAQANSHRACLAHLRTISGKHQHAAHEEDPLAMLNEFESDEAKLLSSKAFRLLEHKTQVLTAPSNPFIRNRKTHVLEVVADSVVTAGMLGLNTSLARSIAIGHDVGHVPFGHPGEQFLAKAMGKKAFCHEVMAPLVTQKIERRGKGLDLTWETLDGMMRHSGNTAREGMTQEAWVVRHCDKFAYLFADYHDIKDRMRYPLPRSLELLVDEFGRTHRERTCTVISGLIVESAETGKVSFDHSKLAQRFKELRSAMMEVYVRVTQQNLEQIMAPVLEFLTVLDIGDPFLLFALMTDRDVISLAATPARNITHLHNTALAERLEYLPGLEPIDLCNPYLDW